MNFIEDLYYGRFEPHAEGFFNNPKYKEAIRKFDMSKQKLENNLSEDNRVLLNEVLMWMAEAESISDFESFRMGFCMGVKMMHDSLR